MSCNRRQFLTAAAAATVLPRAGIAASDAPVLEVKPGRVRLVSPELGDYPETEVWGFDGGVLGPLIQPQQGDVLQRRLINRLPQPTAVHWHGLRIPNAMDGIPGMTQDPVPPGGKFVYELPLKDAGTYWYHSHNQSTKQVARGLYGVIVVEETEAPEVDQDIVVALDDWRLSKQAQITDDFGAMHDWTRAGRLGNYTHAKINPQPGPLSRNQRVRLWIVNVTTDGIMAVSLRGLTGKIVAQDGMPLRAPEDLGVMVFGPAERADVIADITAAPSEPVQLVLHERDAGYLLWEAEVTGNHAKSPRGPIAPLSENPINHLAEVAKARSVPLNMEGGAMGGLRQGCYKGKLMDTRELVEAGQIWTFNGEAGLPEEPLVTAGRGEVVPDPHPEQHCVPACHTSARYAFLGSAAGRRPWPVEGHSADECPRNP